MTRTRAALAGAPSSGSYRCRADAAAQNERHHRVRLWAWTDSSWCSSSATTCRAVGVSQAGVVRNMGRTAALSAESAYVRRVLPVGALRNLGRGLPSDLAAPARAGAIVAGLAFTGTGFLKVRWTRPAGPPQKVGSTLRNLSTGAVATGSRHHAVPLRGHHPAFGQPFGQHAATSGPAGHHRG
jgi:hypothetical protein